MILVDRVVGVAGNVLVVLVLVLGVLAVLRVAWLAVRAGRRRQLVVQALTNLTGHPKLDADAAGLTQTIRDALLTELRSVHGRAQFLLHRAKIEPGKGELAPPRSEIEGSLKELSESVTSVAPDRIGPFARLLSDLVLRPAGTRIRGSLVRYGENNRLGAGFEVVDLRGELRPATFSLWAQVNSLTETSVLEDRARMLARVSTRALAIELLRLDLLRRQRRRAWRGAKDTGVVSRFVGLIYQASALTFRDYQSQLYALSVEALRDAANQLPDDYHPQKDLGDTQSRWRQADPQHAERHRKAALNAYDRAEEIIDRAGAADACARRAVRIGRALAQFKAEVDVADARQEARDQLDQLATWDQAVEEDEYLLYNTACLLALEIAQPGCGDIERLKTCALQLLRYALLRDLSPDRTVFDTAERDSDLDGLRKLGVDTVAEARRCKDLQQALLREPGAIEDPERLRAIVTEPNETG